MLVDKEEVRNTLLPLLRGLPVACDGGWFPIDAAAFGPGWKGRNGDLIWSLANELPKGAAMQLRRTLLLPPRDPRWGVEVEHRSDLFDRAGVCDGLRLQSVPEVRFHMSSYSYELPDQPPASTPQTAWDNWRNAVSEQAKPYYDSWFEYALSDILLLPEIHYLETLSSPGQQALSRLLLASLTSWPDGWESVSVRKLKGNPWSRRIRSPLSCWLQTAAWLSDDSDVRQPLGRRWLVPPPLLQSQRQRFRHLDPLSLDHARKLEADGELKRELTRLVLR